MPSEFSMTLAFLPSITATHEFVVPRSIPMTFPMVLYPCFCGRLAGPRRHPNRNPLRSNIRDIAMVGGHIGGGEVPARTERKFGRENIGFWKNISGLHRPCG